MSSTRFDAVLACAFGAVHRLVGAVGGDIGVFAHGQLGNAGAEGDQQLLVIVQEEALGQFALQTCQGNDGVINQRVRQYDQEFLSAVAATGVLHGRSVSADGLGEMA